MDSQNERNTRSKTNSSNVQRHSTETNNRQITQVTKYSDHGVTKLRETVEALKNELDKQKHRYKSLSGTVRKLNSDKAEWKDRSQDLESDYFALKERYDNILSWVVVPYARSKGVTVDLQIDRPSEGILRRLFKDAMRTEKPVSQAQNQLSALELSKSKVKDLIEQCRASKSELQISHERILEAEEHNQILRLQVRDLQADLLAKVDKKEAVPDDQLGQDFRTLVSMVRTLSRMITFAQSVDIVDILTSPGFLQNVSPRHWKSRAQKKRFIEAWIWAFLHQFIFDAPFSIFGYGGTGVTETWKVLFGIEGNSNWPSPLPASETWRCATAEYLVGLIGDDTTMYGTGKSVAEGFKGGIKDARNQVQNIIEAHLHSINPDADTTQVSSIVVKAFKLAKRMSLQRSRLRITYPEVGDKFSMATMSVMPDQEGEDTNGCIVAYVATPGLTKWGDARGENYDHRFDIVPSLVHLEHAGIKREVD
ncbi:hypothetical protein HBI60_061960 [Parastagonospora nodorum]|nr:hypothetical protein HBI60_061960 [Parastagonospora nodorum]